ncbi:hypothetical protein HBH70_127970 [Parastagonospora nodorum]|nr:hypothetical protein HBH70_127970 [Parastagonospora nodorum]
MGMGPRKHYDRSDQMRYELLRDMVHGIRPLSDAGPSGSFSKRPRVESHIHCSMAVHRPATAIRLCVRRPRLADASCDIMANEAEKAGVGRTEKSSRWYSVCYGSCRVTNS